MSVNENWNIWRAELRGNRLGTPRRLLASLGRNHSPSMSPDGRRVAFVSDLSGTLEIWLADASGGQLRRLTDFRGCWLRGINWSPDGRQIAFDARLEGHAAIFLLDVDEGTGVMPAPRAIELNKYEERMPSWVRNGKSLYFNSDRDGNIRVWRRVLATNQLTAITPISAFASRESWDGRYLYFDMPHGEIWQSRTDGSEAKPVAR